MNTRKNKNNSIRILPMAALIVLLVTIPLVLYTLYHARSAHAEWYNSAWSYRQAVRFGNTGSAVTDQKVLVQVNTSALITAGKLQSSCQDMRFTDAGGKLLQYYINVSGGAGVGCNDTSSDFYVLMPSIVAGNNLIFMYYGNPSAIAGTVSANFGNTTFSPTSGPTQDAEEKSPGPVAMWKMDEGQGSTAADASGHGNSLTLTSTAWATSSASLSNRTQYLQFNGATSVASRANDTDFDFGTGSFSISAWIRHSSNITGTDVLITKYNTQGWKVYMNSSGFICFGIDDDSSYGPDDSACTTTSYADSMWHHIEVVKQGTTSITVYVDGNQKAQTTSLTATATLSTIATLYIGADSAGNTNWWDGWVDDVAIYPYARTASQIKLDILGSSEASRSGTLIGASASDPLTNGLVGYWKMDETTANTCAGGTNDSCDASGNRNDAAWSGNTAGITGKYGSGVTFDGTGDDMSISDNAAILEPPNDMSISLWVNLKTLSRDNMLMAKDGSGGGGYYIQVDSSNQLQFGWRNSSTLYSVNYSSTITQVSTWLHIVAVKNGNTMYVYLNGMLGTNTRSTTGTLKDTTSPLYLGSDAGPKSTDGRIDEVRIYNRALSPSEIRQLYSWAPGPVGWWKLDENTGQSFFDSSGNGFSGTVGASTSVASDDPTWAVGKFGSSLNFDGIDDDARVADNDAFSFGNSSAGTDKPYTFEIWVYPTNNISHYFFDKSGEYEMRLGSDGRLICKQEDNSAGAYIGRNYSSGIAVNGWHHVACSYDGSGTSSGTRIYLDGVRVDNANEAAGTYTAMENLGNAFHLWDSTEPWVGKLDDVRIYNYVRTPSQVVEDMNGGHPPGGSPVESDIIHWKFDEASGATANNAGYGGSGYNGTISGATWYLGGKVGSAIATTTSTNFVSAGDQAFVDNLTGMSIGMWVKPISLATNKALISKTNMSSQNSFMVATDNSASDEIRVHIPTSVSDTTTYFLTSNLDLSNDTWSYLNVTYNASESASTRVRVYKNGKEVSGSVTGTLPDKMTTGTTSLLKVGASDSGSYTALNGVFDDVKIYPYALTYDQMLIDYNGKSSLQLGSLSTDADGTTASSSATREFCVPGDTTTCRSPVAYWKLDEHTGQTINDSSGNGINGNLGTTSSSESSDPLWSAGKIGPGLVFDGVDDIATVSDADKLSFSNNTMSASAWVRRPGTSIASQYVLLKGITTWEYRLIVGTGGSVGATLYQSGGTTVATSGTSTYTINDGNWHYIAFTSDGSTLKVYVDGNLDSTSSTFTGSMSNTAANLYIGDRSDAANSFFSGNIDQVKLYDYALSQAQIAWEYNRGAPIAHYKFDECQGSTAYNVSRNADGKAAGNNGTITIGATGTYTSAGTCGSGTSTESWNGGTTGKYGASLAFDGTDDVVTISNSALNNVNGKSELTMSAWVKPLSAGENSNGRIIEKDDTTNGYLLYVKAGGVLACIVETATGDWREEWTTTTPFSSFNAWHFVTATYSSTTGEITLYVDGTAQPTTVVNAGTGLLVDDGGSLFIGNRSAGDRTFNGLIDDVRLYNYALTGKQIGVVMNENAAVRFGP